MNLQVPIGNLVVSGPAGPLEARFIPVDQPRALMLVCHPHPLYGGTMDNKVVTTLARAARDNGVLAVRFNFRGVGSSAGSHDHGAGERDDCRSVLAALRSRWPSLPVVLAGFSFGAAVAAHVAQESPLAGLVLVAPPVRQYDMDKLTLFDMPLFVVQGLQDAIVDPAAVKAWLQCVRSTPQELLEIGAADHFFHGALPALKAGVSGFLSGLLV